jgi:hypothetical protein
LPDGLFSNKKYQFGYILVGLGMENFYIPILYYHLEYFIAICYNLWQFGIVCCHLVYLPILVCLDQEKSGKPDVAETDFEPAIRFLH